MVFSSFIFLFYFLPITLFCYFLTPNKFKNFTLTFFSLLFYAWGAPKIFPLFMLSCVIDFFISKKIDSEENLKNRKIYLWLSIIINLSALVYYKYSNFIVSEIINSLFFSPDNKLSWSKVILPIGISFFTFHKISYTVDIYRKTVRAEKSFINYCLYISLFPQLIAGPIVRFHDISKEITKREHTLDKFFDGFVRFSLGLSKKILIADSMGLVADTIFNFTPEKLSTGWAWLGIISYSMQIYFDFSGYSDMAIGLAKVFGFTFLENFNSPYLSKNITEFWRRWHISLSRWMRDYLYIPLGGNKLGTVRTYFNLWIVFLISGLWHGASFNFILWGAYHGIFLCLDKIFLLKLENVIPKFIQVVITYIIILISWVLFRVESLDKAFSYIKVMFSNKTSEVITPYGLVLQNYDIFILIVSLFICFFPKVLREKINFKLKENPIIKTSLFFLLSISFYLLSILKLSNTNYSPFIYFQF